MNFALAAQGLGRAGAPVIEALESITLVGLTYRVVDTPTVG